MNWKTYVEKKNATTFVLPVGWDSRDDIAEQLECSPDKVDDHLRPSLKSGDVEKSIFPVWDRVLKRLVRVVAYRETKTGNAPAQPDLQTMLEMRKKKKTWAEIAALFGITPNAARHRCREHHY